MEKQIRQFDEDRDFRQEIIDLIHSSLQLENFSSLLEEYHSFDISNAIIEIEPQERISLFNRIDLDLAAGVFEHLETDEAIEFIKELPLQLAVKIIDQMDTDDAVDLLQYLESEEEDLDIVSLLSPKKRIELKKLWVYSEDEIGSRMSNSFIELTKSMSVKDAMKKVTMIAADTEYISILYVVSKHALIGYLKLKQLIVARASQTIEEIMETHLIFAHPHDDKEDVALKMQDYGESSMPIVDDLMHMVGIVTYDDLMDIISEEKSEDYTRFAALAGDDVDIQTDTLPVRVKKRIPWLVINLFLSLITSIILSLFGNSLTGSSGASLLAARLAVYLPMILGMSGNTGTQSLAVMIRYLATNKKELSFKGIFKYLSRELGTGIFQGFVIGLLVFSMILITHMITGSVSIDHLTLMTAIVTSGSVFVALILSTTLGAIVPLLMEKFKIDPAVASGPFISTVSDITTLSIYYSIALAILLPLYL